MRILLRARVAFEVMIDIIDVTGDQAGGIGSIPVKFGVKTAAKVAALLYTSIIVLDPLPFLLLIDKRLHNDLLFLVLILIPVISYVLVSRNLLKNQSRETVIKLKTRVFLTMQIGCIAYLIGVIF